MHLSTLQRATSETVRTRPSTAVTLTVYPTNSFPDLLFEQIKRQKLFFLIRGWRFITRAFGSQCDITAARFDGMSTIYYHERTYMRYADTFLMIMRRDYSHPFSECYRSFTPSRWWNLSHAHSFSCFYTRTLFRQLSFLSIFPRVLA